MRVVFDTVERHIYKAQLPVVCMQQLARGNLCCKLGYRYARIGGIGRSGCGCEQQRETIRELAEFGVVENVLQMLPVVAELLIRFDGEKRPVEPIRNAVRSIENIPVSPKVRTALSVTLETSG
jgi:hypothetical protein